MKVTIFTKGSRALNNASVLIKKLKEKGLTILDSEIKFLTKEECDEHYHHIINRDFYGDVVKMFESSPSLFLLVEGDLNSVLDVVGENTDPSKCNKDSFRTLYGDDLTWNACHRTANAEDAVIEYNRFWGPNGYITKFRENANERLETLKFLQSI